MSHTRLRALAGLSVACLLLAVLSVAVGWDDNGRVDHERRAATAHARVSLAAPDGDPVDCQPACNFSIGPRRVHVWQADQIQRLPDNWSGSALIESEMPLAVIAVEQAGAANIDTTAYSGLPADADPDLPDPLWLNHAPLVVAQAGLLAPARVILGRPFFPIAYGG